MTNPVLPLQTANAMSATVSATETVTATATTSVTRLPIDRLRGLLWKLAFATLVLMAIGSATRVANAGLACPDWPLCYGKLLPAAEMNLQVFLEWFHRLDASLIGVMTMWLVARSIQWRSQLPAWMLPVSLLALVLVVVQGGLGALTVTKLLQFEIVTAHLGTALLFFATIVASAVALLPHISQDVIKPFHSKIHWAGAIAAFLIYLQSLLGALVSSQWALHQCLGGFASLCRIMYGHMFGVIPPTLAVLILVVWAWRLPHLHPLLHVLAYSSGLLVLLQIGLGFGTFSLHLQVEPLTVAHQLIGAMLLGVLIAFFILARRDRPVSIYHTHAHRESATASAD